MALSKNLELFHKEIFPKVKYDESINKYKLELSSYIPLKLTKKQFRQLENICKRNNIILEKLPEILPVKETKALFTKMNYLKKSIENNPLSKDILELENEYYKIRTTLFEGHQQIIYRILFDNIKDLEDSPFKDDIIQESYEHLIYAIDNYSIDKSNGQTFRWYLYYYSAKNILKRATYIKNNDSQNKDFINMTNTKELLKEENNCIPSIQTLSRQTELSVTRIKELLVLEQIINADNIERLTESEQFEEDQNFNLEEIINRKLLQEALILIIDTLSNEQQKEVIKLYCGLGKDKAYQISEIADLLGISRQRATQHRDKAIEYLKHPARLKYIKELYEAYTQIELPKELTFKLENYLDEPDLVYEKLEKYLLRQLGKDKLISLINILDKKYQNVLLTYLELNENESTLYTEKLDITKETYINQRRYTEKLKMLDITPGTYIHRRRIVLNELRKQIQEQYIDTAPNGDIKNFLDYLMYNYLNNSQNKTKTRKKDGTN